MLTVQLGSLKSVQLSNVFGTEHQEEDALHLKLALHLLELLIHAQHLQLLTVLVQVLVQLQQHAQQTIQVVQVLQIHLTQMHNAKDGVLYVKLMVSDAF